MQKSLYSLILMDDVVREIDAIARKQNTNRSNLINQILAEYVSMVTPEQRIYNIFNCIDNLLGHNAFDSYIEPNESTMSLKSSLNYRYRPTIRYLAQDNFPHSIAGIIIPFGGIFRVVDKDGEDLSQGLFRADYKLFFRKR